MRLITFAEAKKAPKKLLRATRSETKVVREVKNSIHRGGIKKALIWDSQGMSVDDVNKKMQAWGEKVIARKKAISLKNKSFINKNKPNISAPIELDDKQWKIVQDKTKKSLETVASPNSVNQLLKPKGSNIGLKAAGVVGLTALTVGGGVALYRKMRSDKGKKRGSYKNFNFLGRFTNL